MKEVGKGCLGSKSIAGRGKGQCKGPGACWRDCGGSGATQTSASPASKPCGGIGERHRKTCTLKAGRRGTCAGFFILILFTFSFITGVLVTSLYRAPPLNWE